MKVALFVILTDSAGGAERVATTLARTLAKRPGWRVEFLIMGVRGSPSFVERNLPPSVEKMWGTFNRERYSFLTLPLRLIGRRYDLVFTTHIHTNALLSGMRAMHLIRISRLITRETTTVFDRFSGTKSLLFRFLYRLYGSQDLCITQTKYMKEHVEPYISQSARQTLCVLPNPVDLEAIDHLVAGPVSEADDMDSRPNIVFCGRLIPVKRPALALEAFDQLANRHSVRARLVFVGDGPLRAGLEIEVAKRELQGDVLFLGNQENPYAIMARCQYGVLTSDREGFPNVVLEMMSCGVRAVVMTPCAGDLDALSGVTVTKGFGSSEIAAALDRAIREDVDFRATFRKVVTARSAEQYLDVVLGANVYAA